MNYAGLLLHLDLAQSNKGRIKIASDLAERLAASVIGVAVCQPMLVLYNDGVFPADLLKQDRRQINEDMKAAEAEFRAAFDGRVGAVEWRPIVTSMALSAMLANETRCADLVISGPGRDSAMLDQSRHLDIGDFIMRAGRPCLILPPKQEKLALDHVLIGWKDSAATRRAVRDALPLLRLAARVTVVEIAAEEDLADALVRVRDVAGWLLRHNIKANPVAMPSTGDDAAGLDAVLQEQTADLFVAGAYGRSRLREWVLGGVTRDLLLRGGRPALVSH